MAKSKKHPWADSYSNEINPKIRKGLREAATLLALQVALEKADDLINTVWSSPFIPAITKQSLQRKFIADGKARDKAMEYLEEDEDKCSS